MFALATAALVGAAEAVCQYLPVPAPVQTEAAWAYQWKFSGKTTKADVAKCNGGDVVIRVPASLKIEGWSFYCDPACGDFEAMQADEIFWMTIPRRRFSMAASTSRLLTSSARRRRITRLLVSLTSRPPLVISSRSSSPVSASMMPRT